METRRISKIGLKTVLIICLLAIGVGAKAAIPMRGVVYDVGLKFGGTVLSSYPINPYDPNGN